MKIINEEEKKELIKMVKQFDLSKIDTYGDRLNDNVLLSLVLMDVDLFHKLEPYMSEMLIYRSIKYINSFRILSKTLIKYKFSLRMENTLISIFNNPALAYGRLFPSHLTTYNEPIYVVEKDMIRGSYSVVEFHKPDYINYYDLVDKLINNKDLSYRLVISIYTMLSSVAWKDDVKSELIQRICSHQNFSTARAILKEMENI